MTKYPRLQEGKVLSDDPLRPHGGRGRVDKDAGVANGVRPSAKCDVVDPGAILQLDVAVMLGLGRSKSCQNSHLKHGSKETIKDFLRR